MSSSELLPQDNDKELEEKKEKIFTGRYQYFKDGAFYSEEIFEVYSNELKTSYWYESQYLSRIETGELLKIQVEYQTDQHWTPLYVRVDKFLGTKTASETYHYNADKHSIFYSFESEDDEGEGEVKVPPKFHITTPSFLSSMLFTQYMRFSTKGADEVYVITSYNDWIFTELPKEEALQVGQRKQSMQKIEINGNRLPCVEYSVNKVPEGKKRTRVKTPPAKFYLSKHIGIPYRAELNDGIIVTVDKLTDHRS